MRQIMQFANIIVMVLLIIVVALQSKSAGLGNVFGGAGSVVSTRSGFEKWLLYANEILGELLIGIKISFLFI